MRQALLLALLVATTVFAEDEAIDSPTGLIVAPGWLQVRAHCGGCHTHALVTQQRGDRQTWLDIIRWMQETQNLWQFSPEVETEILDYLEANYPPAANRRRAPISPPLMPKPVKPSS